MYKRELYISYDRCCLSHLLSSEQRQDCKLHVCLSVHLSVAMQFGQLLTHLDTTQQMINNSLKDNNTLLTQVGSLESRWSNSQMTHAITLHCVLIETQISL